MDALQPQVRQATESDHEAAAECLALAFADDPAWAHLLPEDETRAERLLGYFTAEIDNLVPDHRELWVTEDGCGAAIWGRAAALAAPCSLRSTTSVRPRRRSRLPGVEQRA